MCLALGVVTAAFISLNVALPSFAQDTGATQTQLTWIVGAYGLVFAALLLPAGAPADRVGRREVAVGGLPGVNVASLAAGLVESPGAGVALRGAPPVGAAGVRPSDPAYPTNSFSRGGRCSSAASRCSPFGRWPPSS